MSDSADLNELFADRPATIRIEGFGEVPVHYIEQDNALPRVGPAEVYSISPAVGWVTLGTEVVVYDPDSATAHVLDNVAALLWQCLDGISTLAEIFADIADAFGQELSAIESDLATVVAEWKRAGLISGGSLSPTSSAEIQPAAAEGWRHLVDPPNN